MTLNKDTANNNGLRKDIRAALQAFQSKPLREAAITLLSTLGYRSDKTAEIPDSNPQAFLDWLSEHSKDTEFKKDKALFDDWLKANILFQLTNEELTHENRLFKNDEVNAGLLQSYLFFAIELKHRDYARGKLTDLARQLNRVFPMPVMVFIKHDDQLSIAVINRRRNKRDADRDVLGKVTIIRDITVSDPHRGHLDILQSFALPSLPGEIDNFDTLHAAWEGILDTEQLNRRFYRELFVWFNQAVAEARFPTGQTRTLSSEEHVIRLITRLLFIWFIKEKELIANDLFVEERIAELIKDYHRDKGDAYYRVILQNLFFATLNTEIEKRGFSEVQNSTHRNFSLYRYQWEMNNPDRLLALFKKTPFINGGLFDCLDSEEAPKEGGYRIDCFTDNVTKSGTRDYRILSIPNHLFFGDNGLFHLFNHYKFTVEENTPIEQEVALDPELLGKVFENLLAAYNPETKDTVRKRTGSYYTPREVVDYMIDEALVAALTEGAAPNDNDMEFYQARLHYLLDYADAFNDADELFEGKEKESIVQAIAAIKILDPAVGSGAFPMGVLHKLTLALQRLDPDNRRWGELQKTRAQSRADAAFETKDQQERNEELLEISETFQRYSSNFGRKLYLIQNSIFGVDIQPLACQITKLRFFISLAIEQKPDQNADNFGIKPLPNLETRFVAADTLLKVEDASQLDLFRQRIEMLKTKLSENREKHFHATSRQKKLGCRREDKKLRKELSDALHSAGLSEDDASKIALWDPYDQNTSAGWFDQEYMFGITDGFDIVIGNPPYIQLQKNRGKLGKIYKDTGYKTFTSAGDIYQLFYEKGCELLRPTQGILAYITSNSWLRAEYGKALRRYFAEQHTPLSLLEMGKDVFENAIVDTNILISLNRKSNIIGKAVDMDRLTNKTFPPDNNTWGQLRPHIDKPWMALSKIEQNIMNKMETAGAPLKEWDISIYRGVLTGYNEAFIIDNKTREALIREDPRSAEILKPVLRGRDIKRYQAQWAGLWLIDSHNGYGHTSPIDIDDYPVIKRHLDKFYPQLKKRQDKGITPYNLRNCAYHELFEREKLLWIELVEDGRFAYDESGIFGEATTFMMTGKNLKYLCAILNSKLIRWYLQKIAPTSGTGTLRWKKIYVEKIPVPEVSNAELNILISLVSQIISDSPKNTLNLEIKLNYLICNIYDLTEEEIALVTC